VYDSANSINVFSSVGSSATSYPTADGPGYLIIRIVINPTYAKISINGVLIGEQTFTGTEQTQLAGTTNARMYMLMDVARYFETGAIDELVYPTATSDPDWNFTSKGKFELMEFFYKTDVYDPGITELAPPLRQIHRRDGLNKSGAWQMCLVDRNISQFAEPRPVLTD
jgi:hypothetical protein